VFASAQIKYETSMGTSAADLAWTVIQDADSNYVYSGWTNSHFNDILVTKTNSSGGLIWSKTFFTGNGEVTEDIAATQDGYILGGSYIEPSNNDYDFLLTRIDTAGNITWSKRYHGSTGVSEIGLSVIQTSDGGFLLGGLFQYSSSSPIYPLLVKTDSTGNMEWCRYVFAGTGGQMSEVMEIPGKKYIGIGAMYLGSNEIEVFCVDSTGAMLWDRLYGGTGYEYGSNVSYDTTDHSMVIGGSSSSYGQGSDDFVIFKTDSSGNVLWSSHLGNTYSDEMVDIEKTWDGGYIFTGNMEYAPVGANDIVVGKLDSLGNLLWMKSKTGSTMNDDARNVVMTHDKGFLVTGNYNNELDIFSAKFDYLGNTCTTWTNVNPGVTHTPLTFTPLGSVTAIPNFTVTNHNMMSESTLSITPSCTTCQNFSVTATSNSPACLGGNLNLTSTGAANTVWQGPAFTSTNASPVISNVTPFNAGTYYLYANNGAGCYALHTLEVIVDNCLDVPGQNCASGNFGSIYPNPSNGIFTLSISHTFPSQNRLIEITDIGGKLIYTQQNWTEDLLTIDLSQFEAGMYFVRLKSGNMVYYEKLIRQ
jgi:hypothetical protein